MERIYTPWDIEEAYPLSTYQTEAEALTEVATAVTRYGEDAVATWGLFLATPYGESRETIATGHDLIARALQHQRRAIATA